MSGMDAGSAVTVIVRRRVKPGQERAYEAWLDGLVAAVVAELPGYLGAEFHKPATGSREYRSVFRFASLADLDRFERSDLRARHLAAVAPLVEADAVWERLTGLELWLDPPPGAAVPQPSPHRMALVLMVVVFALVLAINLALGPLMAGWPLPLRLLVAVILQVGLMTYLIMPRLTPLIARWIYPTVTTVTR
jgi:antibiotic biosynthesis monooxygenase (ABM) superfamily enzyme